MLHSRRASLSGIAETLDDYLVPNFGRPRRFIRCKHKEPEGQRKVESMCTSPKRLEAFYSSASSPGQDAACKNVFADFSKAARSRVNSRPSLFDKKPKPKPSLTGRGKLNKETLLKGDSDTCLTSFRTESTLKTEDSKPCFTEILTIDEALPDKSLAIYRMLKQKDERIEELAKGLSDLKAELVKSTSVIAEMDKQLDAYKAIVDFCSKQLGILEEDALYCSESQPITRLANTEKMEEMMLASYQLDMWKAKAEAAQEELKHVRQEVKQLSFELANKDRSCKAVEEVLKRNEVIQVQLYQRDCEIELLATENKRLTEAYEREASANKSHVALVQRLSLKLAECRRQMIKFDQSLRHEALQQQVLALENSLEQEELQSSAYLNKFMKAMTTVTEENTHLRQGLEALKKKNVE